MLSILRPRDPDIVRNVDESIDCLPSIVKAFDNIVTLSESYQTVQLPRETL